MHHWIGQRCRLQTAVIASIFLLIMSLSARSDEMRSVDVAIVFAVDTSFSIDREQAIRQRDGHIRALRSKPVLDAITSGAHGCIAIAYIEWSSSGMIQHILPWTRICNADQAAEAAKTIEKLAFSGMSRAITRRTSISYAIDVSSLVLKEFPGHAERKVIDISSNGTNNDGVPVTESRQRALDAGHVINAIILPSADRAENAGLPSYFRQNVIGGPGSFAITSNGPEGYSLALLKKLVQEIASLE